MRRDSAGVYAGAKVHVTSDVVSGGVTYPGGDYPKAIRDLGAATGITVIDNTMSTLALGKQIFATSGATGTANLQAWVSMAITSVDDTHTNIYGGAYYAYLIATDLAASTLPLKDYVLPGIAPPDLSILVVNPNWKPIAYTPPARSTVWTTTAPWQGSVFGDIGGVSKVSDGSFSIAETSASPLVVSMRSGTATAAAGKIAAATDGIAFYFQQVPIEKDFTLKATATVTSIIYNNSQVGFGLMVRDAAWTDTSRCVAAELVRRRRHAEGEQPGGGLVIIPARYQRAHATDRHGGQLGGGGARGRIGHRPDDRQGGLDVHLHVRHGGARGLHHRAQRDRRRLRLRRAVHRARVPGRIFER